MSSPENVSSVFLLILNKGLYQTKIGYREDKSKDTASKCVGYMGPGY
jgi:hypothetical protein